MANLTLSQVAEKQSELLEKMRSLPATDTNAAILDLLQIQVYIALIMTSFVEKESN